MSNGPEVAFVGTLGRDPELRYTTGGRGVANTSLAVARRWPKKDGGGWEEATTWFNLVIWGETGENAAASLVKGSRVMVSGRLEQRSWEDKESGDKRTAIELIVDEIGPSLRWATCEIAKTERTTGGDGGYHANEAAGQRPEPVYADEEPF